MILIYKPWSSFTFRRGLRFSGQPSAAALFLVYNEAALDEMVVLHFQLYP